MSIGAVVIDNLPSEVAREFVEVRTRIVERNGTFEEERIEPELAIGFAAAVRETRTVSDAEIDNWIARRLTGVKSATPIHSPSPAHRQAQ